MDCSKVGNMKRVKFYVCPNCGNVLSSTSEAKISSSSQKIKLCSALIFTKRNLMAVSMRFRFG